MTILLQDTFTRTNATSLGNADTGQTWQMLPLLPAGSVFGTNGSVANIYTTRGGTDAIVINAGASDCILNVDVLTRIARTRLFFRAQSYDEAFMMELASGGVDVWRWSVNLGDAILGTTTAYNSSNISHVKIELQGSSIKIYFNGSATPSLSLTSAFLQAVTTHGIGGYNATGIQFDNFIIEDFNTGGTPTTQDGTVSIIGTGTLASTGRILKNSSASLVGTGSLSATATKLQNALASMVGTGTLTATPVTIKNGQASVVGQGLFIANASTQSGIVIVDGNASLLGNGVLGATATTIIQGNANLMGKGTFASNGIREAFGSVSFIGNGLFNVDLREITIVTGEAWLIGSGLLEARAQGRTWEDAPYLAVPMYAVVQATEKNWKEVIQEKVKF